MIILFQLVLNIKHFHETPRNYTKVVWRTCHGIGFTWASLPISKYAHIVAVDSALDKHFGILKHLLLIGFRAETGVKHEFFLHILVSRLAMLWADLLESTLALFVHRLVFLDSDFQGELVDYWDGIYTAHSNLIWIHGSYSAIHTNFAFHVLDHVMEFLSQNGFSLIFEPQSLNLVNFILVLILEICYFAAALFLDLFKLLFEALGHRFQRLYLTLKLRLFIPILRNDLLEFFYLVFENIHFALGVLNIFVVFLFLIKHLFFKVLVFFLVLLDIFQLLIK